MTDPGQFEANKPPAENAPSGSFDCAAVELLLAESVEKALPSAAGEQLRIHAVGCAACREKLAQVRRGHEWLLVLKQESLEPPVDLVTKILARTSLTNTAGISGATEAAVAVDRGALDFAILDHSRHQRAGDDTASILDTTPTGVNRHAHNSVVVLRRTLFEPRVALVAAMAFFSISLTLNLMGIKLTSLHPADLTPRGLRRAATRQYADTNARVVRYYENLRIVYEVEARVQQLRRAAETNTPPEQDAKPRKQSSGSNWDSSAGPVDSHRLRMAANPGERGNSHTVDPTVRPDPKPVVAGPRMDAAFHLPSAQSPSADLSMQGVAWHTLTASFALPFKALVSLPPALRASTQPFPIIHLPMNYFSTRERRLAWTVQIIPNPRL